MAVNNITDLNAERNKRLAPDQELIRSDDFGKKMYLFLLSYEMNGNDWMTEVWAYDFADAENRAAAMKSSLRVDGQAFRASNI